jgi:tape measure domain-containing protein
MANRLDLTLRINSEDRTGPARAGLQSIEQQLTRLRQTAGAFLALKVGQIISSQIGEVIKTADAYKTLEGRLKLVSDNTGEYAKAQTELFAIAQRTRGDLGATYNVYGKLETAIKQLGGTQAQALTTTETLNQAIALTSQGASQDAAAIMQFSQALGSGVLRGDEFNSVMENSPGLAQALADGLDVPITKLRSMAEAGQLTADKLINALGQSSDIVAEKFAKIPLTVGGATTQLNNAFTQFIGLADKSSGASATLANGISTLAKNLNTVADAGLIAAEIYGAKLVLGLSRSTQSLIEGALAARARAAADQQAEQAALALLRVETQTAQIRLVTTRGLIEEARLQMALASTERQRTLATQQMARAMASYHAAENIARANQLALTNALGAATVATTNTERAFIALNGAMQVAFSFQIGMQVGEWLNQFEKVRIAGSYVAEAFVMLGTGAAALFNNMPFAERWAQIQQIHADFDLVRANSTDAAVQSAAQITAAEETKAQAVEAAALKQQASFKVVEEATKALTASIDTETKQQTTLIEQSLTERLAAIDAMDASETQKDTLRVNAKLAAYQQEAQLQQQASDAKLMLIDQEYAAELTAAATNTQRTTELENQKREAKLAVYTGLANYYQNEIARLAGVYASEFQATQQATQQLKQLNQSHEQALFDIKLMGMDKRQQLEAKQIEYDKKIFEVRKELGKGEQADQERINALLSDARNLHADITRTAGEGASAISKAKERENQIWTLQKGILEDNAEAHENNAERAKAAQASFTEKLADTRTVITEITDRLNKDYALKMGIDPASLSATQSTMAELTKPETKVITIVTQQTQETPSPARKIVREGNRFFYQYEGVGQSKGGPAGIGFASGGPIGYAQGGYTPRTGKLPGFGGGDKIRALLEAGEFIVRKEAVQKVGLPFMQAVNAGQMTLGGVIKRAAGGSVGYDLEEELRKKKDERDKVAVFTLLNNPIFFGTTGIGTFSSSLLQQNARKMLEGVRPDVVGRALDVINNSKFEDTYTGNSILNYQRMKANLATQDKIDVLREHIFDPLPADVKSVTKPTPTFTIPKLPAAVTRFNESTASAKLLQPAQAPAAGKTINVQFAMPGGEAVSGQFNESDIDKLFKTLKEAGLRSSGGHF